MSDLDTARQLAALQAASSRKKSIDFEAEVGAIARDLVVKPPAAARPARSPRSHYGPGAGQSGGPAPRTATVKLPDYLRLDNVRHKELDILIHKLHDALATRVYLLLCVHCDFEDGEFFGNMPRLMDLCTPSKAERGVMATDKGRRGHGPTYKQMRHAIQTLIDLGLVERSTGNAQQGQLRLYLTPRVRKSTSGKKEGTLKGRV